MTNMFDEQSAAAIINPSVSAAAAALTIAMLNSNAGAGGTNVSTGSVSAVMPQLSLQLNQNQQQLTQLLTGKDSRWLQLEICREYQRGQCVRSEQDCKYAHPPSNVEIQNGRVTACFDSIKGRCSRENPKCKYLHPPQHLKDQLLANGKQNLVMKNLLSQQYSNQMPAMPALAQITQQQYSNPLALQSALSLPYFIPSLYPGQANLLSPVPDPFSAAFQGTVNNTNPYISVTSTGSTTKRQKTETTAISNSANTGFKCTPTTVAFGMPLYATPQFNPYLLPTAPFLPAVPFSGQPRFH
uniref:Muscleblind-like protein n=2 Tax=Meloidogyne TaxID=189290 RepID=A0A6V7XQP5_MELEN|nr:unnamed protein product [Meloidogyne enterolobii]